MRQLVETISQLFGSLGEVDTQTWVIIVLVVLLVVAIVVAIYQWRQKNQAEDGTLSQPAKPQMPERPSLVETFKSRGRLRKIYVDFEQQQSAEYRRAMEHFVPLIVMGPSQSGKSRLIDRFTDWQRQAKQLTASSTNNPELSLYLGTHTVVEELSANLLEDTSADTMKALKNLWEPLVRNVAPIVAIAMDVRMLRDGRPEDLKGYAELLRSKINILRALRGEAIETRIALTHLDDLEGFEDFAHFAEEVELATELRFDRKADKAREGGADLSAEALEARLRGFSELLPSTLTRRESDVYLRVLRFLERWPELAKPLSSFLTDLTQKEAVYESPALSTATFSSYAGGTCNPLIIRDGDLPESAGADERHRRYAAISAIAGASVLLVLCVVELAQWRGARNALDESHSFAGMRTDAQLEEEDLERDRVIEFVLKRDGWRRLLPAFVPQSTLDGMRDELAFHIRQNWLYPALCDAGANGSIEEALEGESHDANGEHAAGNALDEEGDGGRGCLWRPTYKSLYLVTLIRAVRGSQSADVVEDGLPISVRWEGINQEIVRDYLSVNVSMPGLGDGADQLGMVDLEYSPERNDAYDPAAWSDFIVHVARVSRGEEDRGQAAEGIHTQAREYWGLLNDTYMPDPNHAGQLMEALRTQANDSEDETQHSKELARIFRLNHRLGLAEWLVPADLSAQHLNVRAILRELAIAPSSRADESSPLLRNLNRRLEAALEAQRRREESAEGTASGGTPAAEEGDSGSGDSGSGDSGSQAATAGAGGSAGGSAGDSGGSAGGSAGDSGGSATGALGQAIAGLTGGSGEGEEGTLGPEQRQQIAGQLDRISRCLEAPSACRGSQSQSASEGDSTHELYQVRLYREEEEGEGGTGRALVTIEAQALDLLADVGRYEDMIQDYLSRHGSRPGTRIFFDGPHPSTTIVMDYRSDVVFAGYHELDGRYTRAAFEPHVQEVVDETLRLLEELDADEREERELRGFISRSLGNYGTDYVSAMRPYYRAFRVDAGGSVETLRVGLRLMSAAGSGFDAHLRTVVQNTRYNAAPGLSEVYQPFLEQLATFEPLFALIDDAGQPTELLGTYMTLMAAMLEALDAAAEPSSEEGAEPGLAELLSGVGRLSLAELRRDSNNYYDQVRGWVSGTGLVYADQRLFYDIVRDQFSVGATEIEGAIDGQWEALEPRYEDLASLYPFHREADTDASPTEINDLLQPDGGAIPAFVTGYLAPVSLRRNGRYRARSCPLGRLSLSGGLYTRANRAVATTEALYPDGTAAPLAIEVRPVVLPAVDDGEPAVTLGYIRLTQRGNDVTVYAFNQQPQSTTLSMSWQLRSASKIGLQTTDPASGDTGRPSPIEVRSNFFSLLHLLERANVEGDEYQWTLEGDEESYTVRFEIVGNPWAPFSHLRAGGQGGG